MAHAHGGSDEGRAGGAGRPVLSIGKPIPAERQLVVAANLAAGEEQLYALLKDFHVLLPIHVSGTKTLGMAEDTMVSPLSPEGSRDHRTLWVFHKRLLEGKRA